MQDFLVLIDFLMEKNAKCKKNERQYRKTIKRLNRKIEKLIADNEELRNQIDAYEEKYRSQQRRIEELALDNHGKEKQLRSYIGGPRYDGDEMGG